VNGTRDEVRDWQKTPQSTSELGPSKGRLNSDSPIPLVDERKEALPEKIRDKNNPILPFETARTNQAAFHRF
jgi:hypothetical protein